MMQTERAARFSRNGLKRSEVSDFFSNIQKCLVGLEAKRRAHSWARLIGLLGPSQWVSFTVAAFRWRGEKEIV